jgi:hypothetical protein
MSKKDVWWVIAGVLVLLGAALWGPIASNVEHPKYRVLEIDDNIEIRDYAPMIVAEAEVSGEREAALGEGFRIVANYIFGENASTQKLPMITPVTQRGSEKIAMTAPVTQRGDGHIWQVRFVMPAIYTMETLPKPKNSAVTLIEIPRKRFAVIRFSGMAGGASLKRHTEELSKFVNAKNLRALSGFIYAFYNPPWTLPFLRRNEVMVEVAG